MDTPEPPPITDSLPWRLALFLFAFGASLATFGFIRLWPDPYALSMGAYTVGIGVVSVVFVRWHLFRHLRITQRTIERKMATYKTVATQLNVVLKALPDQLPEDAYRAVWNIQEELRMSFEDEAATVRRPLP